MVSLLFLMTMLVTAGLLLSAAELARIQAGRSYFAMAADSAVESAMASYDSSLWENYRILAFYESEPVEDYMEEYLKGYGTKNTRSFLNFSEAQLLIKNPVYLNDEQGRVLIRNVSETMMYEAGGKLLGEILEESRLLETLREAAYFLQTLLSYGDRILEMEQELQSLVNDGETRGKLASQMQTQCSLYLQSLTAYEAARESGRPPEELEWLKNDCEAAGDQILYLGSRLSDAEAAFQNQIGSCLSKAQVLGADLKELAEPWMGKKEDSFVDIWSALEGECEELQSYALETGEKAEWMSELLAKEAQAADWREVFLALAESSWGENGTAAPDGMKDILGSLNGAVDGLRLFSRPSWMPQTGNFSAFELKNSLSELSGRLLTEGTLGLFVEDTSKVSNRIRGGSALPSENAQAVSGSVTTVEKLLFENYLCLVLGGYTNPKHENLSYEWEYCLYGEIQDRENLRKEAQDLFLIRMGTDFLEMLSQEETRQKAEKSAAAVVGFTGNAALVHVTALLFMGVWAADSAVTEVQALLKGEKVPLFRGESREYANASYEDYLKLQMLLVPAETLSLRALDCIQGERQKKDSEFLTAHCLVSFRAEAEGVLPWVFVKLPLLGQSPEGTVSLAFARDYSY